MFRVDLRKDVPIKIAIPVMIAGVVAGGLIGLFITLLAGSAVVSRNGGVPILVYPEVSPRVSPPSRPPSAPLPTAPPPG